MDIKDHIILVKSQQEILPGSPGSSEDVPHHALQHQYNGGDEVDLTNLPGLLLDSQDAQSLLGTNLEPGLAPTERQILVWDDVAKYWKASITSDEVFDNRDTPYSTGSILAGGVHLHEFAVGTFDEALTHVVAVEKSAGASTDITVELYDKEPIGTDVIVDGDMEVTGPDVIVDGDMEVTGPDVVVNGDFSLWADPTVPDSWAKFGTHDANNYVEESLGGGCRLVSDGTNISIVQTVVTIGKTYRMKFDVTDVTSGNGIVLSGSHSIPFSLIGSYEIVFIADSPNIQFKRGGICDITIDNLVVTDETVSCAAYTVYNSGLLSKQEDAYEGVQCLRIEHNGVNNAGAVQTILTIGKTYKIKGRARGDGNGDGIPRLRDSGGASMWTGIASTDWQEIDIVYVALGTDLRFYTNLSTLGHYCEYDVMITIDESVSCAAYTVGSAALLSKQEDAYEGVQCLRVEHDGTGYPYASQVILTIGKTYHLKGVARGDGTVKPAVRDGAGPFLWDGTDSVLWQEYDLIFVATTTSLRFYENNSIAGHVEFDAVFVLDEMVISDGDIIYEAVNFDIDAANLNDTNVWFMKLVAANSLWLRVLNDDVTAVTLDVGLRIKAE